MQGIENNTIKVLQIAGGFRDNVNGRSVSGGVTAFLNNYYSKMDEKRIHFDFLAIRNQCFENYRSNFEDKNSILYTLDIQSNGAKRFFMTVIRLTSFLKHNKYDSVHINIGAFFPVLACAIAAKLSGVNNVITHSHSSGINSNQKRKIINIISPILSLFSDQHCACSLVAAENLYSRKVITNNKFKIIKNAIDVDLFRYNNTEREKLRNELNLTDKFVVGHVGRFVEVKNHDFLIDFFAEFIKKRENSVLLLVGDGELKPMITAKVKSLNLDQKVIFLGEKKDVYRYYQAMDIFVMPSIVEGFPIVALEAQSTGLPTYISSNVTSEASVTKLCTFFHLNDGPQSLVGIISKDFEVKIKREDASNQIIKAGFDMNTNLEMFESLYF